MSDFERSALTIGIFNCYRLFEGETPHTEQEREFVSLVGDMDRDAYMVQFSNLKYLFLNSPFHAYSLGMLYDFISRIGFDKCNSLINNGNRVSSNDFEASFVSITNRIGKDNMLFILDTFKQRYLNADQNKLFIEVIHEFFKNRKFTSAVCRLGTETCNSILDGAFPSNSDQEVLAKFVEDKGKDACFAAIETLRDIILNDPCVNGYISPIKKYFLILGSERCRSLMCGAPPREDNPVEDAFTSYFKSKGSYLNYVTDAVNYLIRRYAKEGE